MAKKHRFYLMNVMLYSMITLYNSYIPLKLSYLAPNAKGLVLAITPVISLFAPILWGIIADRMRYRKHLFSVMCIMGAAFFFAIFVNTSYLLMFPIIIGYAVFSSSFGMLSDTITIGYCTKNNIAYGRIRLMGTIGYGFFAVLSGALMKYSQYSLPILYLTLAIMMFFVINSLPEDPHEQKKATVKGKQTVRLKQIFKIPNLALILFFSLAIHFPLTYFYSFYSDYVVNVSKNPEWYWGVVVFATVLGEIPLLIYFDKLTKKLNPKYIFIISGVLSIIRYTSLMLLQNIVLIVVVSLLTGYVTTMTFYTATRYIANHVSPEAKATGQAILYSATAFGGMGANIIGGFISSKVGIKEGMLLAVILSAMALVLMLVFFKKEGISPEKEMPKA